MRKEGAAGTHKDFRVRRSKILCVLQWLRTNNRYYQDVTLDEEALAQLPEDGELSVLSTVTLPLDDDDHVSNEGQCDEDTFYVRHVCTNGTKKNTQNKKLLGRALVRGRIQIVASRHDNAVATYSKHSH